MNKNIYMNISIAVFFLLSGILIGKYLTGEKVTEENVSGAMYSSGIECVYCNFVVQKTYYLLKQYKLEPTPVNVANVYNEALTYGPPNTAAILNDKKDLIINLIVQGKSYVEICNELYDCLL